MLCFSFGAIMVLKYAHIAYLRKHGDVIMRTLLTFGISLFITLINGVLGYTLRLLLTYEKYECKTSYNVGVAKRIAFVSTSMSISVLTPLLGPVFEL